MKISDKSLGYSVIALCLIGFAGLCYLLYLSNQKSIYQVTVIFEDVGSLQPQDPVMDRGIRVGQIGDITYVKEKANVNIIFDLPLIVREGTTFTNRNFSLMGDRLVDIRLSSEGRKLFPGEKMIGAYEPGIAEALHLVEGVLKEVSMLHQTIMILKNGNDQQKPLAHQVNGLTDMTEELIDRLGVASAKYHPSIQKLLHNSNKIAQASVEFANETQRGLDSIYLKTHTGLEKATILSTEINTLLTSLNHTTEQFVGSSFYKTQLGSRELINDVTQMRESLQAILDFLGKDGGILPDSTGKKTGLIGLKNVNLFGATAREKRKDRENTEP